MWSNVYPLLYSPLPLLSSLSSNSIICEAYLYSWTWDEFICLYWQCELEWQSDNTSFPQFPLYSPVIFTLTLQRWATDSPVAASDSLKIRKKILITNNQPQSIFRSLEGQTVKIITRFHLIFSIHSTLILEIQCNDMKKKKKLVLQSWR